jgi:hypothetical protein
VGSISLRLLLVGYFAKVESTVVFLAPSLLRSRVEQADGLYIPPMCCTNCLLADDPLVLPFCTNQMTKIDSHKTSEGHGRLLFGLVPGPTNTTFLCTCRRTLLKKVALQISFTKCLSPMLEQQLAARCYVNPLSMHTVWCCRKPGWHTASHPPHCRKDSCASYSSRGRQYTRLLFSNNLTLPASPKTHYLHTDPATCSAISSAFSCSQQSPHLAMTPQTSSLPEPSPVQWPCFADVGSVFARGMMAFVMEEHAGCDRPPPLAATARY